MTTARGRLSRRRKLLGWLFGLALPALATLISVAGRGLFGLPTDVMLFVLAVALVHRADHRAVRAHRQHRQDQRPGYRG